jgi:hypothetical protein
VKGYGENDRILIKMCNQTHNITDVLKKARYVLS